MLETKLEPKPHLPFFTLILLISFASVNAVLFTPALPTIAEFFTITTDTAQLTITWFLVGYTLGQLLYGPIANRYGRKIALYAGISLQIFSSLICVASSWLHHFDVLLIGRFFLALGSGVGLKITFTLVNECLDAKAAAQKIAYLTLAFALTPGIAVALGGFVTEYYGWASCFFLCGMYGVLLFLLVRGLPETLITPHLDAFKLKPLIHNYVLQFKNRQLITGSLLMGISTGFIYVFAMLAPFIAINLLGMSSASYGLANLLPSIGLIIGSLVSAQLTRFYSFRTIIRSGIVLTSLGVIFMLVGIWVHAEALLSIFVPTMLIYFGLTFIIANASGIAMGNSPDKAHASATMSFINLGFATLVVLSLELTTTSALELPAIYLLLCVCMMLVFSFVKSEENP